MDSKIVARFQTPSERSTSRKSSLVPNSPMMPAPCTPPPRPPRPKISLPNMRPTIILSPLAIQACTYRLPPPTQSIKANEDSFVQEVLASYSQHVEMQMPTGKALSPYSLHHSSSHSPAKQALACDRTVCLDDQSVLTSKSAHSESTCIGSAWTSPIKEREGRPYTSDMESAQSDNDACSPSWLCRNRKFLWMLATLCFVLASTAAIAGGIIWRLTFIH